MLYILCSQSHPYLSNTSLCLRSIDQHFQYLYSKIKLIIVFNYIVKNGRKQVARNHIFKIYIPNYSYSTPSIDPGDEIDIVRELLKKKFFDIRNSKPDVLTLNNSPISAAGTTAVFSDQRNEETCVRKGLFNGFVAANYISLLCIFDVSTSL